MTISNKVNIVGLYAKVKQHDISECHYAECVIFIIMLSVVMLNVVAPEKAAQG